MRKIATLLFLIFLQNFCFFAFGAASSDELGEVLATGVKPVEAHQLKYLSSCNTCQVNASFIDANLTQAKIKIFMCENCIKNQEKIREIIEKKTGKKIEKKTVSAAHSDVLFPNIKLQFAPILPSEDKDKGILLPRAWFAGKNLDSHQIVVAKDRDGKGWVAFRFDKKEPLKRPFLFFDDSSKQEIALNHPFAEQFYDKLPATGKHTPAPKTKKTKQLDPPTPAFTNNSDDDTGPSCFDVLRPSADIPDEWEEHLKSKGVHVPTAPSCLDCLSNCSLL